MPKRNNKKKKEKRQKSSAPSRGMWSGTISFGLVSVPVSLFPAVRSRPVHLRWLSQDGIPLRRNYVCAEDEEPLSRDEIVRGYELDDGRKITVTDGELDEIAPEKSNDISLTSFVELSEIPSFHFDRPYFLAPGSGGSKAYQLLTHVMEDEEKVGIGSFVMRGKEYLVAIIANNGLLMAETLRFRDELRSPEQIPLPQAVEPDSSLQKELNAALDAFSQSAVDKEDLKDRYAEKLTQLVKKKRKDAQAVYHSEEEENEDEAPEVIDLVSVFKARMREAESEEESDMSNLSKEELYEHAQDREIPGRSKMSKDELLEALSA